MDESVKRVKAKGSTTCVMAALDSNQSDPLNILLNTVNLGDSGYLILRPL